MSGNARSETGSVSASVRTEEDSGARTGELTPPKYSQGRKFNIRLKSRRKEKSRKLEFGC